MMASAEASAYVALVQFGSVFGLGLMTDPLNDAYSSVPVVVSDRLAPSSPQACRRTISHPT